MTIQKLLFTEKIIDIVKFITCIFVSISIIDNLSSSKESVEFLNVVIIISCFVIILNLINFLRFIKQTQKLIITLIEIFVDLRWTLTVAIILILGLSFAI